MTDYAIHYDRDTKDFEVIVDGQLIGWRGTWAEAEALANETATRIAILHAQSAAVAAHEAAQAAVMTVEPRTEDELTAALDAYDDCADNRAQALLDEWLQAAADTPACRTCGGPVEIDGSVGLGGDDCDACAALCCEACGESVSFDTASILGDEMVCAACYAAQQAHVEAMAALAAADERRAYRAALEDAGSAADEAQRLAQFLQQAEDDEAHDDDEPLRTCAAEDRYARGGW